MSVKTARTTEIGDLRGVTTCSSCISHSSSGGALTTKPTFPVQPATQGRSTAKREPFQSLTPENCHHFLCLMVPWKIPLTVLSVAEQTQSWPTVKVIFPEERLVENNYRKEFRGNFLNWNTFDLQYCVSLRHTANWSVTHTHINRYPFSDSFLLQVIIKYWV